MLLKMHFISSLIIQIGAFFSFLFIYFNPLIEKTPLILHESTSLSPRSLIAEKTNVSLEVWSKKEDKSNYYHLISPKGKTWKDCNGISEEFYTLNLTLQESSKDLYSLSSEKGLLNLAQFDLSLLNTSIRFSSLGGGFAKSITISSFTTSPSIQIKGFSGYVNSSTEVL